MTDWKELFMVCDRKLGAAYKEIDRLKVEQIKERASEESQKILRDTIENQRTKIDELKEQVEYLQNWIQESLVLSVEDTPGFSVDLTNRHICPCGCGNRIPHHKRKDSVYFTRACKEKVSELVKYYRKKTESQS